MKDAIIFVVIIGCVGFLTFAGLSIASLSDYNELERTITEFLFVGRLPGTSIFFDFDSFIASLLIFSLIAVLTSQLRSQLNRRWSSEHAEQIGI